jgi:hypothetical protein
MKALPAYPGRVNSYFGCILSSEENGQLMPLYNYSEVLVIAGKNKIPQETD